MRRENKAIINHLTKGEIRVHFSITDNNIDSAEIIGLNVENQPYLLVKDIDRRFVSGVTTLLKRKLVNSIKTHYINKDNSNIEAKYIDLEYGNFILLSAGIKDDVHIDYPYLDTETTTEVENAISRHLHGDELQDVLEVIEIVPQQEDTYVEAVENKKVVRTKDTVEAMNKDFKKYYSAYLTGGDIPYAILYLASFSYTNNNLLLCYCKDRDVYFSENISSGYKTYIKTLDILLKALKSLESYKHEDLEEHLEVKTTIANIAIMQLYSMNLERSAPEVINNKLHIELENDYSIEVAQSSVYVMAYTYINDRINN